MPFDIRQLIEMAPLIVGAMKPGSPEAAAMMRGFMRSQEQRRQQDLQNRQLSRQDEQDQQDRAYRQAQIENLSTDNARQNEALGLQRENANLNRLEKFRGAATGRAQELIGGADLGTSPTDPGLQNQIALDQFNLANQYGVPGAQSTTLPNTSMLLSGRKKNRAKEIYEQAKKTYGDEAIANDAITIKTGELFGDMKPSQLRALYEMPVMQAAPEGAPAIGQPAPVKPYVADPELKTPGSFDAHFSDMLAAAEEKAGRKLTRTEKAQLRLGSKKDYDAANDRPRDPALVDLNRQLLQTRVDTAQQKVEDTKRATEQKRTAATRLADDMTAVIDELLDTDGQTGAVRLKPGAQSIVGMRMPYASAVPGSQAADADAAVNRLTGNLVVDLMQEMKSQSRTGATGFGQLSERELAILQSAASKLTNRNMSERAFAAELKRIRDKIQLVYQGQPGGGKEQTTAGPKDVTVKAPNGKTYTFKSQADADAFKKAAGIQ